MTTGFGVVGVVQTLARRAVVLSPDGPNPRSAVEASVPAQSRRRILRTMDLLADEGRPHGGSNRPFGFEADKVTVRESEAMVVRAIAARFVAGESLRSLAVWLEESGVRTVRGGHWKTPTIAAMLTSGRIAGLREHHGAVVSKAVWPAILSVAERDAVLAVFARRKPAPTAVRHRYLLTGLLRCGRCGNGLYSSARSTGRRYVCMSGPDHGGCGKLAVVAEPIEKAVVEAAFTHFESLSASDRAEVMDLLGGVASAGSVGDRWADLTIEQRHMFVRALLDSGVVEPGRAGAAFDPGRVRPVWRADRDRQPTVTPRGRSSR